MRLIKGADGVFRIEEDDHRWTYVPITAEQWKRWLYQTYQNFSVCLTGCGYELYRRTIRATVENVSGVSEAGGTVLDAACHTRLVRIKLGTTTHYFQGQRI